MLKYLLIIGVLLLAAGCGDEAPAGDGQQGGETGGEPTSLEMPQVDKWLVIQDSLGVELGDSNLVFGTIVAAQFLPNGNIAIGDMGKTAVSVYSPEGEFLASVGQKGQGPGEYLLLSSFAVTPDNGFIVPDAMGGKINFYDSGYGFTHELSGFFPSPPVGIAPVPGGFVGLKPAFEQNEDEMLTGMSVCLWTDSAEADVVYRENLIPFDMNDMGAMAKTAIMFTVDGDGNVILAQYDVENYRITSFTPEGQEIWTIEEDFPMVRKPQEDIEIEREIVRNRMTAGGAPPAMADSYEPDPYRSMVASLSMDNHNRLWVMSGLYEGAVFRVYDAASAEYLFTAALRTGEEGENIMPVISPYGILAFDPTSDDWPRVYIVGSEDPSLFQTEGETETPAQI